MRAYRPRAYAQGELDNLCGLYAVVNGIRHTLGPAHRFGGDESVWLFQKLIEKLGKDRRLEELITEGATINRVVRLLKASQTIVAARWGYAVTVQRPFYGQSARKAEIIEAIRNHQQLPSRSALILFSYHWSVVRRSTATRFNMLDSFGYHRLRFTDIRVGKPRTTADEENWFWLSPSSVFLLADGTSGTNATSA